METSFYEYVPSFFTLFCLSIWSGILLGIGIVTVYRSKMYVTRHCRVTFAGVEGPLQRDMRRPFWKITVLDEGDERSTEVEDIMRSSGSYSSETWALRVARRKQIDEVYKCYRHPDYPSKGWGWTWHEPTKLKAFSILFVSLLLFTVIGILFILRIYYLYQQQNETNLFESTTSYRTQSRLED